MKSAIYKSSIKTKILIGFGSAIIILVFAGIVSYQSFQDLMRSLEFLSKPENKLIKCNDLLSDLSLSESNIRSYFISSKKKYLDRYNAHTNSLEKNIDSLTVLAGESTGNADKINKITNLWTEKKKHTQELILLYENRQDKKLPDGILSKLNRDNPDVPTLIITKTITIKNNIPPVIAASVNNSNDKLADEKRSIISRIFKKKDKNDQEIDSVVETIEEKKEVTTLVDTLYTADNASEIREEKFTKILTNIRQENSKARQELKDSENEIIQKEIGLIEYIRNIVIELKDSEERTTKAQIEDAKALVELSIMKLLLFGITGISAMMLFGVILMNDATKTNYQKSQLVNEKKQAEELVKAKEGFLANMSHEIRTPLNSIIGFTEQLSQTQLFNKQKYYLQAVSNSSSYLLSLVNDILDHSRIEAGKIDFEETTFYLKDILDEVINVFHLKASEKNLKLISKINGSEYHAVTGDPLRLKQILFNLVSNAIKFTDSGSIIIQCDILPVSPDETKIIMSVSDTGIGIPSSKLDKIFETFTQADSSISRKFGGTGLGLAISKKLVELQGGRIIVKSQEGEGSEFSFSLKYKKGNAIATASSISQSYDLSSIQGMKILVVEDDEFNLLLFHTILIKWNCDVSMASNGNEAIEYLNSGSFDLIITDIHMPGMSGVDLFKWIKSNTNSAISKTPVVAVTANVIKESMKVYKDSGFDGILLKPFKEEDLAKAVLEQTEDKEFFINTHKTKTSTHKNDSGLLSDFIKYSGGSMETANEIVNAYIKNMHSLLEQVNTSFEGNDWRSLKTAVHKLNPGFGHLNNGPMTFLLAEVEKYLNEEEEPNKIKLESMIDIIIEKGYEQINEVIKEKEKWKVS